MADIRLFPDDLVAQLKALEDRVRTLEAVNRGLGGTVIVTDPTTGQSTVEIGNLNIAPAGMHGILIWDASHTHLVFSANDVQGFATPYLNTAWRDVVGSQVISSATFVDTYQTVTELLFATELLFRVAVNTDVGTTGELRLSFGGATLGSTKTIASGTVAYVEYRMVHSTTIGGGPIFAVLQARRASGAGTFRVFQPEGLHYGANLGPVAGGWV